MRHLSNTLVLFRGAGDLGTGAAWRLHKAGIRVVIAELAQPLVVRRAVAFANAIYEGEMVVEGVTARRAEDVNAAKRILDEGAVPVLIDPAARSRDFFHPHVLIDAIVAKRNTGTRIDDAALVVALGPGFMPKVDCHAVVETNRGHNLGRVYWDRAAEPNTGVPGEIGGESAQRVLRAPTPGEMRGLKRIGDLVRRGEIIAQVDGTEVLAPFNGILRGIAHDGLRVRAGMKIGDVDPRANWEHCFTLSDKSLAVGGGVLQALLEWMGKR